MLLYLVRHGKAEAGDLDGPRPLTDQGRKAVKKVAKGLDKSGVQVPRIEHSGLLRAEQTAQILAEGVGGTVHVATDLEPTGDVRRVAHRVAAEGEDIMLVGHLPFMERLASYLLTGNPDSSLLHFRTGAVACLSGSDSNWTLEWFLAPALV